MIRNYFEWKYITEWYGVKLRLCPVMGDGKLYGPIWDIKQDAYLYVPSEFSEMWEKRRFDSTRDAENNAHALLDMIEYHRGMDGVRLVLWAVFDVDICQRFSDWEKAYYEGYFWFEGVAQLQPLQKSMCQRIEAREASKLARLNQAATAARIRN